jgi:polyphosphate kinase 2 (PPK2 family)
MDAYMAANAEMLGRTSIEAAPWYVVPTDHKWYGDVVVASVVAETLESMGLNYSAPEAGLEGVVVL